MPRKAMPHWDPREQCYRTEVGGRTKYFRKIGRDDQVGIARAFAEYLAELVAESRFARPDVYDLVLKFTESARGIKPKWVMWLGRGHNPALKPGRWECGRRPLSRPADGDALVDAAAVRPAFRLR